MSIYSFTFVTATYVEAAATIRFAAMPGWQLLSLIARLLLFCAREYQE